jgi:glycosyltransferase involved in cell wall biosynthesis
MKILMVINNYLPFIGGAEIQAHKLSRQLVANGNTVHVLTSKWSSEYLPSFEVIDNVNIYRLPCPYFKVGGKKVGQSFFTFCNFLIYLVKSFRKYDIVHTHQALRPALAVALASRIFHRPTLCKIGNSGKLFDLTRYQNTYFEGKSGVKCIVEYIDIFISISKIIENALKKNVSTKKIVSIPNGVDIDSNSILAKEFQTELIRVVSVGSLTAKKCFNLLIDAISDLDSKVQKRLEVKILGDGPERKALENQINNLQLNSIITLAGNVNNVSQYMRNSEVFILVSTAEGMSNSLLEALAHGLPAICSDVGNNGELIIDPSYPGMGSNVSLVSGKCGFIFEPNSVEAFKNSLISFIALAGNKKAKMSQNALEMSNQYNIVNTARSYELLYAKLILRYSIASN